MRNDQKQINAEHEEWITIIDQNTGLPKKVSRANYSITEVRPGTTASKPNRRNLTEN